MEPMAEQIAIFANPIAGRGRGRLIADKLRDRLSRLGYDVHPFFERADSADLAALDPQNIRTVIAIGGDGTLRTVAARFAPASPRVEDQRPSSDQQNEPTNLNPEPQTPNPHPSMPPLLIIPMGTANLMGQHLDIQYDEADFEKRVIRAVRRGRIVHLDAAQANGRLFLLMAGVGMDAEIVHELDRQREGPINLGSYFLPAAMALGGYQYPPITVDVDDRRLVHNRPAMVFVGNIKEYGTGFPLLPHARPDDGLLDVCILPCRSRNDVLSCFLHAAAGEHLQWSGAIYTRGRNVRVESPADVPVQVDGEPAGHTPVEIGLLPFRIPFIVP
jgi:diacylglycerol kinase (ATP)